MASPTLPEIPDVLRLFQRALSVGVLDYFQNRAGCETVIGSRCKQSGRFWTVRAANAILALRRCQLNGRFKDYWKARRA